MRTLRAGVLLLLLTTACNAGGSGSDDGPAEPATTPGSLEGDWELVEGAADGAPIPLVDGYRITLTVDGEQLGGTAACNSYGGTVEVDGTRLSFTEIFQTEMACELPVMESESAYLGALLRTTTYEQVADRLVLTGDGVRLEFRRLDPLPTAGLVDTTWELDSLIAGDAVTSVQGEPATLIIGSDGTLEGSTGCRRLEGRWVAAGDTIQLTEFAALGECSPDLADQDAQVVTVLGDGFTFSIDRDRLTITAPGGIGLSYRAR